MIESGRGRRIAILIGTNEYSKLDKLEFAEDDVREMREVLLNPDICGFDEVLELIDKNKEEVSQGIEEVFKNAKKDDQMLIYFSGHGKPSYKFDLCLLFKDTDPDSLLATSLKFDYINECKEQSACNRVVVILDCCYSGTAGMKGDYLEDMLSSYSCSSTILLTSTGQTGSNIAKEDKELKHGVFTSYLLKGLKDWTADYDDDGIITVDDLYRYTFNETKAKGLQRPQIKGSYEGEMVLGRNLQKIRNKEFEQKKDKLMKYLSPAPSFVLYRSLTILQKIYSNTSALEPVELNLKPHLESLLEGEIQAETYVEIVKYQEKHQKKTEEKQTQEEQKHKKELHGKSEEKERKEEREIPEKKPEKPPKVVASVFPIEKLESFSSKRGLTVGAIFGIFLILAIATLYPSHTSGNAPVIKDFSADLRSGPAPLRVQFTSNTTDNSTDYKYYWVFEPSNSTDWNSHHAVTAVHTFTRPGVYNVSLTVTNDVGSYSVVMKDYIKVTG